MRSDARTVEDYLESLPPGRREAIARVRDVIREHVARGYEETMNWGMITWQVPRSVCPDTYNGEPLMYAALASQKRHMAVYLTGIYMDPELQRRFEAGYRASGKRMDVGRSCIRFRHLADLPLDLIAESVAAMPVEEFVARIGRIHSARAAKRSR